MFNFFKFFKTFILERERESISRQSGKQKESEKQAPHGAGSPMQGSSQDPGILT